MRTDFHIVFSWCPERQEWLAPELHDGDPKKRVRQLLGGSWTRSSGRLDEDMSAAFWNAANRRKAFVMRLPAGLPRDAALRVMEAQ